MLRLIERSVASIEQRLVLIAPPQPSSFGRFDNVINDTARHGRLISEMQTLRGSVYLQEGNVTRSALTADGRHQTAEDDRSWHLLMRDNDGRIRSCALFLLHENAGSIQDLRLRHCPLLERPESRTPVTVAVGSEMARARRANLRFAELGGWAISKERRGTPEGLLMAVATYGLSRMLGGALGITMANVAHSCSSILRRLGGAYLEFEGQAIPSYFDQRYNAEIELLRFDSRAPSPKYAGLIDMVVDKLAGVTVVAHGAESIRRRA